MKNYYQTLGISATCSISDTKKAYRKLSLLLHPDVNNNDNAHEKFIAVNEAYQILKDPIKRSKYNYLLNQEKNTQPTNRQKRYENTIKYTAERGRSRGVSYANQEKSKFEQNTKRKKMWSPINTVTDVLLELIAQVITGIFEIF